MKAKDRTTSKRLTVDCLACGDNIYVGLNPTIGTYVICNSCDAEFHIVDLEPVLIDWPDGDDFFDEEEGH